LIAAGADDKVLIKARGDAMATGQQPGKTRDAGAVTGTAAAAVNAVRSGERIFVGTGCGEPRSLVRALDLRRPVPKDLELISIFPTGRFDPTATEPRRHRNRVFIASHPAG